MKEKQFYIVEKQFSVELFNMDEEDHEGLYGRLEAFAIFPTEQEARRVFETLRSKYALPESEEGYTPYYVFLSDYAQEDWFERLPIDRFIVSKNDVQAIKGILKRDLEGLKGA